MADIPPQQEVTILVIATILVLGVVWWMNCHSNPPGESCSKPNEPIYPPLIIGPVPPIAPPNPCGGYIPPPDSWPFPANIQSPSDQAYYKNSFPFIFYEEYEPGDQLWAFEPKIENLGNDPTQFWVNGWSCSSSPTPYNVVECSYTTNDPTYGGRFYFSQQNPNTLKKK